MKLRFLAPAAVAVGIALSPIAASAAPAPATAPTAAPKAPVSTHKAHVATHTTHVATHRTHRTYEVVSGTYNRKATADRRLASIESKGITGMREVTIGRTKKLERIEERGLTRAQAKAKVKLLDHDGFTSRYVRY